MAISQNTTLFTLIGTTYGGDGQSTFGLPDLRGRRPVHQGTGTGLSNYVIGENGGFESVTLTLSQSASHNHVPQAVAASGTVDAPAGNVWAQWSDNPYSSGETTVDMNAAAIGFYGGNQPHENRPPYLAISYIISLFGIFPSRN
jgi:microcystin-dependent protein